MGNTAGQILMSLVMQPPKEGEPSFKLYTEEKNAILSSLKRRAEMIVSGLNALEGVSCNSAEGAMYAFPTITIPDKAIEAAEAAGKKPDAFYCIELLKATGIVVVPGSGFGQKEGTYHFRTTFLPSEESFPEIVKGMTAFHGASWPNTLEQGADKREREKSQPHKCGRGMAGPANGWTLVGGRMGNLLVSKPTKSLLVLLILHV